MIEHLRSVTPRSEIILEEVPAPKKLATYSFAFTADVSNGLLGDAEDEIASGRFVLLHEPGGQDTWEGEFRCVTFLSADVDEAMQDDPLLPEVGWSWLLDSLSAAGCEFNAPSGTVTRVSSASFGKLSPRNDESEIEIRASWSPIIIRLQRSKHQRPRLLKPRLLTLPRWKTLHFNPWTDTYLDI